MHELPITEQIIAIAIDHAQRAKALRIARINVVIGDLSSFADESIQFYFDFLSKGTIAEGAKMQIRRVEARVRCRECQTEFAPDGIDWRCTHCGSLGGDVLSGREMLIDSIEVD